MKIGYARVSTQGQKLETQISLLKEAGVSKIFREKFTGTTVQRPIFNSLMIDLKKGDELIVTKLDRFARNTSEALQVIEEFFNRGVTVNILNIGKIDDTPTGQLIFTIFSAFAQFERDMILSRTQEGKAFAKEHNPEFHEGRPEIYSKNQIDKAYKLYQEGWTYKSITKKTGISYATLYRRFKKITA
ncbi:recombinase family protein [Lactobacillus sp. ESL0681]|uniref:recombinase family protein n=1 Tax=Lactobacillus sp. ESL0681 TaxID=2983211 RepID=UPI0023F8D8F0|nr:recombinase family protein [Lactobacillus sp. ESL0681]WEV41300.1 recombinase family protein [Lactobacillus sp. ESL0681]